MAPILSKAARPPPKNSQEKIERWITKARPLIDSIFEQLKDVGSAAAAGVKAGKVCKKEAETVWESVRVKMDTACISAVRLLESLCCIDVNRFAKPEKPLTGSLPILFVLMLIVMLYNAFVFAYMPAAGIAINSRTSLIFHAWIFMTLASFFQAVRTDPGSTPMSPKWSDKDSPPAEARERKHCSDEARWCRKSGSYKPDRAHYCRVLKKGVLRMDHYCPWLGNTVGFHNQKFFFLFLFYTNAACAQLGISFIQLLVQYTLPALTTFCLIGAEGLTVLVGSLLVPFFLFHFWLIARNTTTIEFCERLRSSKDEKDECDGHLRYDLGIFRNFGAVLGSNPLTWFIPVGGPAGDGINFTLNPAYEKFLIAAASVRLASDKPQPVAADSDDGPEATHPAVCVDDEASQVLKEREVDIEQGTKVDTVIEQASEEGEWESNEGEAEASEEGSVAAGSVSAGDEEGFLVWKNPAEFAEDLTIGCQFIAEKTEDCTRGSILFAVASCVPGAWGRKAAKRLAGTRLAPWRRALSPRSFPESSRRGLRSSSPAVKIVPAKSGGGVFSESGEDSVSSASAGFLPDGQGHFLSD